VTFILPLINTIEKTLQNYMPNKLAKTLKGTRRHYVLV